MTLRAAVVSLLALCVASCSPTGGPGRVSVNEPAPPPAAEPAPSGMSIEEARAVASGHSFLRPSGVDSYEILYFDPGGKASLLRGEQLQIVHGRWVAEMSQVGSAPTPIAAICLSFNTPDAGAKRSCLDPTLLSQANTERAKGDVLGIGRWSTVPETLPRERASLAELRERIRS